MSDLMLMWHGSLQWGRRQVKEWHFLAEMYAASLEILARHPSARMTLQFGGQDAEWLAHEKPELIHRLRELLDRGQIEIAMGGYSHNFQGNVPAGNVANLALAQEVCRKAFGMTADGYWPAESMLNRGMPAALLDAGFRYTLCDSLNFQNAGAMEEAITGKTFFLRGANGRKIVGLPMSRFPDRRQRGEKAGILRFAQNPAAYEHDWTIVLERCHRAPLIVEVGDWEHFNLHQAKVQEVHMGTFEIGSRQNRVDPEKIAAWDRILGALIEAGHTFLTGRETARRHPPSETVELVDGRDYTKNDLTRLVDACGWHNSASAALTGRRDPHRMSDQESYSHSFAGAKAWLHLRDLSFPSEKLRPLTKDVLISFCSAHRSGGEEFTVKQQVLDRVNRIVETFRSSRASALGSDALLLPAGLPPGAWPVALRLARAPAGYALSLGKRLRSVGWLEKAPCRVASFARTHLLWVKGPLPAGRYTLKPILRAPRLGGITIQRDAAVLTLRTRQGRLRFDALNGGNLAEWTVAGLSPFVGFGRIAMAAAWQDAPLCDEIPARLTWKTGPWGVRVEARLTIDGIPIQRVWVVSDDLRCCQARIRFGHRRFQFLSPCAYQLDSAAFGKSARSLMVAEGHTRIASEPLRAFHNVHHLGSELIGFAGGKGLCGMAVNRLVSSPILRRHPISGEFLLMESRPVGAADEAHPYEFAEDPVFEVTLRLAPGARGRDAFPAWQSFHEHPPLPGLGEPCLIPSAPEWTRSIPHLSTVNPHF